MKSLIKSSLSFFLVFLSLMLYGQDVGITRITTPTSGCDLRNETVRVDVFNFGSAITLATVDISYQLDTNTVVTQTQVFTGFGANSTRTVTFTVPINFTGNYGRHVLTVYTDLSTDTDRSNDTMSISMFNYEPSSGGILSEDDSVCESVNGDTLFVTNVIGEIQQWESNIGNGWNPIVHTDTSYTYSNLSESTRYRVLAKNGTCTGAYSNEVTITVEKMPMAGVLMEDRSICVGGPGDTLRLTNYSGSKLSWQRDTGTGWYNLNHTSDTLIYPSPKMSSSYRVIVANNICPADTSNSVNIRVVSSTEGGNITPATATVCKGSNRDTLKLVNHIGNVIEWQFSNDGEFSWTPIASNTTPMLITNNVDEDRSYRVLVESAGCSQRFSDTAKIKVVSRPQGGVVKSDKTICGGTPSDTLVLDNYSGTIAFWQADNGSGWQRISGSENVDTLFISSIFRTTAYRAVVTSPVCPSDTSESAKIKVATRTDAGTLSPDTIEVCAGANRDTLILSDVVGDIIEWQFSTDDGFTWTTIASYTDSFLIFNNVKEDRLYRVLVESDGCPSQFSNIAVIDVLPTPKGGTVFRDKSICGGTNKDTMILQDYVGNILIWQSNEGNGWMDVPNSAGRDTLYVTSIFTTTSYRAITTNGLCPDDTSTVATLSVISVTFGGTIERSDSVCKDNNSGILILHDHIGDIRWWERSVDDGASWTPLANRDTIQSYRNLGQHTWYRVLVEGRNCPDDYSDTAILTVYRPVLSIDVSDTTNFCDGDSAQLTATTGYPSYLWSTGETTESIIVRNEGMYSVGIEDDRSCSASDSVYITVYSLPTADAGEDETISLGASTVLNGSGGLYYNWSPGSSLSDSIIPNPIASPVETTIFQLMVTDTFGCQDTDEVEITVIRDYNVSGTNLITPNGDGINDTWEIENILPYTEATVTILNRYGDVVHQVTGYNNSWDGTSGDRTVSDGTYYYIIEFKDSNVVKKGHITVLSK